MIDQSAAGCNSEPANSMQQGEIRPELGWPRWPEIPKVGPCSYWL